MKSRKRENPRKMRLVVKLMWLVIVVAILIIGTLIIRDGLEKAAKFFSDLKLIIRDKKRQSSLFTNTIIEEESTIIDVVDKVSPSVVSIVIKTFDFDFFYGPEEYESGIGTGFIVDSSGVIVTNSHVVDNEDGEYSIVLKDGTSYEVDKIHLDPISDLAVLEVTARDLPVLELGDSDRLKVGQIAIAIGNALGKYQNTVTVGVVSGIARDLQVSSGFGGAIKTYKSVIQTDAALNPGNSGGPLLSSAGQVIGINIATSFGADNISFAIPVNDLKPIFKSFLEKGKIVRPYLGVTYTTVSREIATLRKLPEGAFISRVILESPAREAGLKRGDIIIKIDSEDINSDNSLASVLSTKEIGDKINLVVDRDGEVITLHAILDETPEE